MSCEVNVREAHLKQSYLVNKVSHLPQQAALEHIGPIHRNYTDILSKTRDLCEDSLCEDSPSSVSDYVLSPIILMPPLSLRYVLSSPVIPLKDGTGL
jgi:hypothetical protein